MLRQGRCRGRADRDKNSAGKMLTHLIVSQS
jgi:hypothetical protein